MDDRDLLSLLRTTPWIAALLLVFDFDLGRTAPSRVWLPSGEPLETIAGDAAGGAFLRATKGEIVYAGSEGEGGLIAHDLHAALALVVGLPSLHDALSRPLGDDLRAWLASGDAELRADRPSLDDDRARLHAALDLPPAPALLAELHESAADENYRPVGEHGPYASMLSTGF